MDKEFIGDGSSEDTDFEVINIQVVFDTKESNEISHRKSLERRGLTGSYESHIFQELIRCRDDQKECYKNAQCQKRKENVLRRGSPS